MYKNIEVKEMTEKMDVLQAILYLNKV